MNSQPLELRKWFKVLVGVLGSAVAAACLLVVRSVLPQAALGAQVALALLFMGAMGGFVMLLKLFLPPLLLKLWPSLEG